MAKNLRALKLVDRCAIDHPGLAAVWFEQGRYGQVALIAVYLERGALAGWMRTLPNVQLAARMVLETVSLWAIHMPWDASPRAFAEEDVERAIVDLLTHSYLKEKAP